MQQAVVNTLLGRLALYIAHPQMRLTSVEPRLVRFIESLHSEVVFVNVPALVRVLAGGALPGGSLRKQGPEPEVYPPSVWRKNSAPLALRPGRARRHLKPYQRLCFIIADGEQLAGA